MEWGGEGDWRIKITMRTQSCNKFLIFIAWCTLRSLKVQVFPYEFFPLFAKHFNLLFFQHWRSQHGFAFSLHFCQCVKFILLYLQRCQQRCAQLWKHSCILENCHVVHLLLFLCVRGRLLVNYTPQYIEQREVRQAMNTLSCIVPRSVKRKGMKRCTKNLPSNRTAQKAPNIPITSWWVCSVNRNQLVLQWARKLQWKGSTSLCSKSIWT